MTDREERLREIEADAKRTYRTPSCKCVDCVVVRDHLPWLLSEVRTLAEQREELEIAFDAVKFACEVEREAKNAANGALTASQQREAALRAHCRIVFYPHDGSYPIEHAPAANKDQWDAIMHALAAARVPDAETARRAATYSSALHCSKHGAFFGDGCPECYPSPSETARPENAHG